MTLTPPVIPRILHMIWVGDKEQPSYVDTYKKEWQRLMPDWQIRLWTNIDITELEFPTSVVTKINACIKGAQKADIMRYYIIYKYGGVYVDTDIIPNRSLDPIINIGRKVVLCHDLNITWPYIINSFFASATKHPLFEFACMLCNGATINTSDINMTTGPRLLGDAVWRTKPDEKYILLHVYYFYRNLIGDQILDSSRRTDDFVQRFGSHFYAASWF